MMAIVEGRCESSGLFAWTILLNNDTAVGAQQRAAMGTVEGRLPAAKLDPFVLLQDLCAARGAFEMAGTDQKPEADEKQSNA